MLQPQKPLGVQPLRLHSQNWAASLGVLGKAACLVTTRSCRPSRFTVLTEPNRGLSRRRCRRKPRRSTVTFGLISGRSIRAVTSRVSRTLSVGVTRRAKAIRRSSRTIRVIASISSHHLSLPQGLSHQITGRIDIPTRIGLRVALPRTQKAVPRRVKTRGGGSIWRIYALSLPPCLTLTAVVPLTWALRQIRAEILLMFSRSLPNLLTITSHYLLRQSRSLLR